ncbi:MAG: GspH/FimT family protein [Pseudomonadota bacterium]|nr:GspH/FimT family protein [Pseudomonadota bacterium]
MKQQQPLTSRNHRGLTLIELVISIAIAAIILSVAVPSFLDLIRDWRRTGTLNTVVMSFQLARSESIKNGRDVVVCSRGSAATCGSTSDWNKGWIVFENTDQDNPPVIDSGETVIREHVMTNDQQLNASVARFVFRPFNRRSTNGTVIYCDPRGTGYHRAVVVSWTGKPRTAESKTDGSAYTC